jgi:membrane associated rhomboid family serine protease
MNSFRTVLISSRRHILFAGCFIGATSVGAVAYNRAVAPRQQRSDGNRVILPLIAANAAIFAAFYFPPAHRLLSRHFLHDIRSGPASLLLSAFAHIEPLHLLFNMVGLYSFGYTLHASLQDAQFLAFYLNAGVAASLLSHLAKARRGIVSPSLGASGAIYGVAAATTFLYPFTRLQFIFFPFVSFPAYALMPALLALDVAGVLLRWRRFDHVAHIGGALAGVTQIAALCEFHQTYPRWYRNLKNKLNNNNKR